MPKIVLARYEKVFISVHEVFNPLGAGHLDAKKI